MCGVFVETVLILTFVSSCFGCRCIAHHPWHEHHGAIQPVISPLEDQNGRQSKTISMFLHGIKLLGQLVISVTYFMPNR